MGGLYSSSSWKKGSGCCVAAATLCVWSAYMYIPVHVL